MRVRALCPLLLCAAAGACGDTAGLPEIAGMGPNPTLPAPRHDTIPTLKIAPAIGWAANAAPVPAAGLKVQAFARGLVHPRWLLALPNGDVLVAETNEPPKPEDGKGIRGWVQGKVMARAGAKVPSPNRLTLLRDTDGNGVADVRSVFLAGLHSPFGMTLVGNTLYVADTDAVLAFPYVAGETRIAAAGRKVVDLPGGPINHHWTKNILASPDGSKLYVTVGSNSNVGERGLAAEEGRAAIWEVDPASGAHRVFAGGLRNPNGMGWNRASGQLWTVVNERDELGSDLVPDYMTSVRPGGFYGWPFSYYGQHVDARVKPQDPALVARAIAPDYALGSHTASLGLTFADGAAALPVAYRSGAFVGQHGSWNRDPLSGYKVIFVPFAGAMPAGPPRDVLTGFVNADGKAQGRPVGVTMDAHGALLVADDVGDAVWRVTAAGGAGVASR